MLKCRLGRCRVPKRHHYDLPQGIILELIVDVFLMFFLMPHFDRKNMFFWKVLFYLHETIDFDAQVSLWEVPGAAQMGQKWFRGG